MTEDIEEQDDCGRSPAKVKTMLAIIGVSLVVIIALLVFGG